MKFSMWLLAWMFALLGAVVIARRSDLQPAKRFWLFSSFTALALAVAPSAGGPAPVWALTVEILSLVGVGLSLPIFVMALFGDVLGRVRLAGELSFLVCGLVLAGSFGVSVLVDPSLYTIVRPTLFAYISLGVLIPVVFLIMKGVQQESAVGRVQARISMWGIGIGAFPFVILTLLPESLGKRSLVPEYLAILAWGIIPAAFAYAILQHQLLGIRRLVHRGMVYGITAFTLLALITLGLTAVAPSLELLETGYRTLAMSLILACGILIFFPLRGGARWIVDRVFYDELVDYYTFLEVVRMNALSGDRTSDVAEVIVQRLRDALRLESAILLLGDSPGGSEAVAKSGEKADLVLRELLPELDSYKRSMMGQDIYELQHESDSYLITKLDTGASVNGYLILGPKEGGEVFIAEEKQLAATIVPILAIAIEKSQLSEDLRDLNQRLISSGEIERGRIAGDVHDGPLQRALLIIRENEGGSESIDQLARDIVNDLREIASRLRPSILDDLGLIPALDWLLDDIARRSDLKTTLTVDGMGEDERLLPDVELASFRIAQEASNNAIKHSGAATLTVTLNRTDRELVLEIADNGKGFIQEVANSKGFGLRGMRERAVQLGGRLEVYSEPEGGTRVRADIPLNVRAA